MVFKKIQKDVDDWIGQYKVGYFKPLEILARLIEEVGEVARDLDHAWKKMMKKLNTRDKNRWEKK